jgi:hypothetical protein
MSMPETPEPAIPGAARGPRGRGLRAGLAEWGRIAFEIRWALALATLLVLARCVVFTLWSQAAFNSDHAVVGLMAKHLAEGRSFPLFFYGQSYMLGVEAWLAALVFLLTGPSVSGLQLPMVLMNVLTAGVLLVLLRRELGLGQGYAFLASLPFVVAPPATALALVEANGGSVEAFLYVLALWVLRRRPALAGAVLGVGFLHREFTIYAVPALVAVRCVQWPLPRFGATWRYAFAFAAAFLGVWAGVQLLSAWSSPFGPGTRVATFAVRHTNVGELAQRTCFAAARLPHRFDALWSNHLDILFGTGPHSLAALGINSATVGQGAMHASAIAVTVAVALGAVLALRLCSGGTLVRDLSFAVFLGLVGVASMTVYAAVGCDPINESTLRYDLLGVLLAVAGFATFFAVEPSRALRRSAGVALMAWACLGGTSHARLLTEYLVNAPAPDAERAAERLVVDGVRHARGNYAVAYRLTFLSGERIRITPEAPVRILEYATRAPGERLEIVQDEPCAGGVQLAGTYWRCPAPR